MRLPGDMDQQVFSCMFCLALTESVHLPVISRFLKAKQDKMVRDEEATYRLEAEIAE